MTRLLRIAVGAAVVATAAACGGVTSTSPIAASGPTVTETFTGTVQPLGPPDVHTFTVSSPGQVAVTMTAAGPPPTIWMSISLGNPDPSGNCIAITSTQLPASTTPQLSGAVTSSGAYCVSVADFGNALQAITYSVTVSHT